ncbi:MAG: methylmalonyl Co-A mutase-associated GTPase MeaB [Gemmatimonadota bacterium]
MDTRVAEAQDELSPRQRAILTAFEAGEERGLARAISQVENEVPGFESLLHAVHDRVGRAYRLGVTGPPGVGKSTLTALLARAHRSRGDRVGVIAVDPTSPFTGGALLGDRVRMSELATEPGVFIRSMASRGSLGGLATASREAADLMDAFGFDVVILETVGVGQSELEIAGSADTTLVVLVPESGDGIQAMKAGLMEVADVFVVNKADRPGAERLQGEIEVMKKLRTGRLERLGTGHHGAAARVAAEGGDAGVSEPEGEEDGRRETDRAPWDVPVLACVATEGKGLDELMERLDAHRGHLETTGELQRRRREHLKEQARAVLVRRAERAAERVWREGIDAHADDLVAGRKTPYEVADLLAGSPAATEEAGAGRERDREPGRID